jgi:hypothetical protein
MKPSSFCIATLVVVCDNFAVTRQAIEPGGQKAGPVVTINARARKTVCGEIDTQNGMACRVGATL